MTLTTVCDECGTILARDNLTLMRSVLLPNYHFCDPTCLRAWATKPPDEEASG